MSKIDGVEDYTTKGSRLVLAVGLVAAAVVLFVAVIAVGGALQAKNLLIRSQSLILSAQF